MLTPVSPSPLGKSDAHLCLVMVHFCFGSLEGPKPASRSFNGLESLTPFGWFGMAQSDRSVFPFFGNLEWHIFGDTRLPLLRSLSSDDLGSHYLLNCDGSHMSLWLSLALDHLYALIIRQWLAIVHVCMLTFFFQLRCFYPVDWFFSGLWTLPSVKSSFACL